MRIYLNISAAQDALPMHLARRYVHKFAVIHTTNLEPKLKVVNCSVCRVIDRIFLINK